MKQREANCRSAKHKWLKNQCIEVESLEIQFKTKEKHKVHVIKKKNMKKRASGCIKEKNGKFLIDHDDKAKRWAG